MPISDPALWLIVRDWSLPWRGDWDHGLGAFNGRKCERFEDNLAMACGWTDESAARVTAAYRRFVYLKALTGETLTPSDSIDRAWHLHLEFAPDYAALEQAVGRAIPHLRGLTPVESEAAYVRGRALWRREFDRDPDYDIWPPPLPELNDRIGNGLIALGTALALGAPVAGLLGVGGLNVAIATFVGGVLAAIVGSTFLQRPSPESRVNCG